VPGTLSAVVEGVGRPARAGLLIATHSLRNREVVDGGALAVALGQTGDLDHPPVLSCPGTAWFRLSRVVPALRGARCL
jgi:hypothetical protein